ncbi:WhiB family transcriptional regulator [Streptomyces sp. NPDC023838]|uniref:WhiB family transcriptional regulator n=1 Tax=Streptomyces sp. NPDC023838 TaxID=3154325 RepID=UPI0033F0EE91
MRLQAFVPPTGVTPMCAQTDPEIFYPETGVTCRTAKAICMACDARAACLEYALTRGERFGVWGGLSERERRHLLPGQEAA